jgi:Uma2 family endonuclease
MLHAPPLPAISVPRSVKDLDSFCRWYCTLDLPASWQLAYLNGEIWIDMSPENIDTHNQVKTESTVVLGMLVKTEDLGRLYADRMLLRNRRANLSTEPDLTFVSTATRRRRRVRLVRDRSGLQIMRGSPDMVLEILSETTRHKDLVILRERYWLAGITEYWIIDALGDEVRFDILRRGTKG